MDGDDAERVGKQLVEWGLFQGWANKRLMAWKKDFKDEFEWKVAVIDGVAGRLTGTHELKTDAGVTRFVKVV